MKRVYIAGPYRAESGWLVEANIREAEAIGFQVAMWGAIPVIPHSMYRFFDRTLTDKFWLEATLGLLRVCNGVVFTPRWTASTGAQAEEVEARRLGLSQFFLPDDCALIPKWIAGG